MEVDTMSKLLFVYDNDLSMHWIPQGLASIAVVLRKNDHAVTICTQDRYLSGDAHQTRYLGEHEFDMICVSVIAGYFSYRRLLSLSDAINRSKKRPCHVICGHGPSPEPDCFLRKSVADAAVIGEGKITVLELIGNYGIEAVDNRILRNRNKALGLKQIIQGIEATFVAGIGPGFNIIFGNTSENRETLEQTVQCQLTYDDGAQKRMIRPVTPYPGSPLYYHAIDSGRLKDGEEFHERKHINPDLVSMNFAGLSDDEFLRTPLRCQYPSHLDLPREEACQHEQASQQALSRIRGVLPELASVEIARYRGLPC